MKKQLIPSITNLSTSISAKEGYCRTEPNVSFISFNERLQKYRNRKSKNKSVKAEIVSNSQVENKYEVDKDFLSQENEKYLRKIYESKFDIRLRTMNDEYQRFLPFSFLKTRIQRKNETPILNSFSNEQSKEKDYVPLRTEVDDTIPNRGFLKFRETNYTCPETMHEFYDKYQKFNSLNRKQPMEKFTPSFAFIKGSNEEKIVPNPLGLLKREGVNYILQMNNQKVGDSYIKVLSNSLKYSKHLTTLQLKGNRMSSEAANSLFSSIQSNPTLLYKVHTLDISDNKIGKNDIESILKYIMDEKCSLENLNISQNYLGDENIKIICEKLGEFGKYRMTTLNLGSNLITDDSMNSICTMLTLCNELRVLILNKNKLTNKGGTLLINQLKLHTELRILDLSNNNIGQYLIKDTQYEEIVNIDFRKPDRNMHNFELNELSKTMRFNFRRNPLLPPLEAKGQQKKKDDKNEKNKTIYKIPNKINVPIINPSPFASALGEYFHEPNVNLIHLDISFNNLCAEDCALIAKEIKDNHNILGIHIDGNEMAIDGLGFITPLNEENKLNEYFPKSQIHYDLGEEFQIIKSNVENVRKLRSKNNCWICEGWREVKFECKLKEDVLDINNHLMKIHLNFDNYKPFDMIYMNGKFEVVRMCPPGEIKYFFTFDGKEVCGISSENKPIKLKGSETINYEFDDEFLEEYNNILQKVSYENFVKENPEVLIAQENANAGAAMNSAIDYKPPEKLTNLKIQIKNISKKMVKMNQNVINDEFRNMLKFTMPRPVKIINKFIKPRTPWTFPVSIWAYYDYEYEGDSEDYLLKCFEFDFNRCQFIKDFKKNEDDLENKLLELKDFLWKRYRDIIDCYKYYSTLSECTIYQITKNNIIEFISHCPNMCNKEYDINNIFIAQKAVIANLIDKEEKAKFKLRTLSDNIVRHQFMNLLCKSAKDKYIMQLKTMDSYLDCVKYSFENHYDVAIKGFEYHSWRKERYYNEQVDNYLKAFLPVLDALYYSWAKQKGPTKKETWMTSSEYNDLIQSFVDINEFPIRDIPLLFNYSMRLQINEISTERHINMLFPEFLEALCRAVDKASPVPFGEDPEEWPKEKRVAQTLVNKLDNMINVFIKLITHPDYKTLKEKFPIPSKDLSSGLYIINYDTNPFYQGFMIKTGGKSTKNVLADKHN